MLFNELRKQHKLAVKRHPMYEKNKFGKFIMYFMVLFWMGYLIFIGTTLASGLARTVPNMEPYHILNQGMFFVLVMDFLIRFPFQKTPTQEVKPYLLLPVKKRKVLDFLLIRSGTDKFNLFWLFMYTPFALLTVTKFFGIGGVLTYLLGIYLIIILNNYWYLLCRILINEKIFWIALPLIVYGLLGAAEFTLDHPVSTFTMNLGEAFITGNILCFIGILAAIALLWIITRRIMSALVYSEINKVEDTKVKNISEYKFLEQYGETGEFCRLEMKMLLRNKRCKSQLRSIAIIVVVFSGVLSFSETYDGNFMKSFIAVYSFVAFGMVILTQLMSFEGNYLDGLMTRKESIYSLLKAKYYLYSIGLIIPFALIAPAIFAGKISLLTAFTLTFFTTGVVYFILFQFAVYNNKTVPLNEGVSGRQSTGTGYQNLVSLGTLALPLLLFSILNKAFGETIGQWIILTIGLCFTLTAHIWIKNVYKRFMVRRYKNMEGFRDSR